MRIQPTSKLKLRTSVRFGCCKSSSDLVCCLPPFERCLASYASTGSQRSGNSPGQPHERSSGSDEQTKKQGSNHSAKKNASAHEQGPSPRKKRNKMRAKAQKPGQFEVEEVTPPPMSLGVHTFHPKVHNGDQLTVRQLQDPLPNLVIALSHNAVSFRLPAPSPLCPASTQLID